MAKKSYGASFGIRCLIDLVLRLGDVVVPAVRHDRRDAAVLLAELRVAELADRVRLAGAVVVPQAERVPDLVGSRRSGAARRSGRRAAGTCGPFGSTAEHCTKYHICASFTMSCQKMMWAEMISPRARVVDVRPHRVGDRLGHPADDASSGRPPGPSSGPRLASGRPCRRSRS